MTLEAPEPGPLSGLSICEISSYESVQYTGRLLAQLGATVWKVEPLAGDPLRCRGPMARTTSGESQSIPFEFLNAGKRSIRLDLGRDDDRDVARRLFASTDVSMITPEYRRSLGVADLPRSVGQVRLFAGVYGGAVDAEPSTALTRFHAASSGYLVPADKDMSYRPAWCGPFAFEAMYGTGAAVAILAELVRPTGGDIDFSIQAYGVWLDKMIFHRVALDPDFDIHRDTNAYPFGGNVPCADGHVCVFVIEEHQWRSLCQVIGRPEWIDDPRFANGVERIKNQAVIDGELIHWCASRTVAEVIAAGLASDLPVGRVRTPRDVLEWTEFRARRFLDDDDTGFGIVPVVTLPFGSGLRSTKLGRAPDLGEHDLDLAASGVTDSRADAVAGAPAIDASASSRPLEGLRVLDFTWAAAGPIATTIMAFLGAEVVKVESRSRPDLMRVANKQYGYAEDDDIDSSPSFQEIAAGKRSIELDLKSPEDHSIALGLCAVADVVIENMRPGKIEELGLSYDTIADINPDVIMCSQSATGRISGPAIPGYAPIFWAEGGGAHLTGWPGRPPGVVRGPVDLHAAAVACLGILAMLRRRELTGRGGYIDCSAIEAVSACFGVELLTTSVLDEEPVRNGNAWDGAIVNDVFPCATEDQWLAVSVRSAAELDTLLDALGVPIAERELGRGPAADGRPADGLYRQIAECTRSFDASHLESVLRANGLAAARSLSLGAALRDARLHDRGTLQQIRHPVIGDQRIVGLPWSFDGRPYPMTTRAPQLGEHREEILNEWGAMSSRVAGVGR